MAKKKADPTPEPMPEQIGMAVVEQPKAKPKRRKVRLTASGVGFYAPFSERKLRAGDIIDVEHADVVIRRGLAVEA